MLIDTSKPAGARAEKRLCGDLIAWLTTVTPEGQPQSSPIWFHWDGTRLLVYSEPGKAKINSIRSNPRVSFHLDGNGQGGDIVTIEGRAEIIPDAPRALDMPDYIEKYREGIRRIGLTPATFSSTYSEALRITPERARYW